MQKWFDTYQEKTKKKITRDLVATILKRKSKMCSFIEWQDMKIVYKRYASLYFCAAIDVRKRGLNYNLIGKAKANFQVSTMSKFPQNKSKMGESDGLLNPIGIFVLIVDVTQGPSATDCKYVFSSLLGH